jgi:phosphoribosylaminoimidazolecarboxamide formyltransferase / IMP cyclohydrolase
MLTSMKYALLSVYNKTGIADFAKELQKLGFTIISTGGTLKALKDAKIENIKHVSELTGFPEILDGRIKTEHPKLVGGILALRDNKNHMNQLEQFGIAPIDLVACNLYPFQKVTEEGADMKTALENIDIGGPNMIRAAAKNFENVVVVADPSRYSQIIEEYNKNGAISNETRKKLAVEAFKQTSKYDNIIFKFLENT